MSAHVLALERDLELLGQRLVGRMVAKEPPSHSKRPFEVIATLEGAAILASQGRIAGYQNWRGSGQMAMPPTRIFSNICLSSLAQARSARDLSYGQHEDRTPTHGYEPTREAAMAARRRAFQACHRWCASDAGERSARTARQRPPTQLLS